MLWAAGGFLFLAFLAVVWENGWVSLGLLAISIGFVLGKFAP